MRCCHGNGLNPKIDNQNTVLEIKKKSRLSLFQKLGNQSCEFALTNPWLPGRKTHTFKCTTQKNIHFCLFSAFNYMLTLRQHNNCKSSCHLVQTATKVTCLSMFSAVLAFFFLSRSVHPSHSI